MSGLLPDGRVLTDLEMMSSPNDWPRWPQLPLKRWRDGEMDCGVIVEWASGVRPIIYLKNLFQNFAADTPTVEYPSLEALVADGWVVD